MANCLLTPESVRALVQEYLAARDMTYVDELSGG